MPSASAETGGAPSGAPAAPAAHDTVGAALGGTRLAWGAAWLAVGISAQLALRPEWSPGPVSVGAGGAALAIVALALRRSAWRAALALSIVCFGMAWAALRAPERVPEPWRSLGGLDAPLVEVEGFIAAPPRATRTQRGALGKHALINPLILRTELHADRVRTADGWRATNARLWLRIDDTSAELRVGRRVRVLGSFSALRPPANPGEQDRRPFAAQRGIVGALSTPGGALIEALPHDRFLWSIRGSWSSFRARGLSALRPDGAMAGDADDASPGQRLLGALVLGQRDPDDAETYGHFATLGIAHLLAVSGAHLGMLVGMIVLAIRLIADRPVLEARVIVGVVVLYTLLVPAEPPILRASVMALALTLGVACGRRYPAINMLGLSAIVVLLHRPADLLAPGFQLSFVVVGALILGVPAARELVRRAIDPLALRPPPPAPVRWTIDALCTAIIAWIVSIPIAWAHFGLISWLSVPATVLGAPVVALLLAWGFAAVLVGFASPGLGQWAARPAVEMADRLAWASERLADWGPASAEVPLLPVWGAAAGTALVLIAMVLAPRGVGVYIPRGAWRGTMLALVLGAAVTAIAGISAARLPRDVVLRVDTLSVGDGLCHIVRTRERMLMIDAGSLWFGVGQRTIPMGAKGVGAVPLHTAIVSHPDIDHFSGLPDAARHIGVQRVIVTPQLLRQAAEEPDGPGAALLALLAERGVAVETIAAGDTIELGVGARAIALHPPAALDAAIDNEASLVLLIEVETDGGMRRVLLTADIQGAAIAAVRGALGALGDPAIHAMDAPHHGSASPEAIGLVRSLDPLIVVQSTGARRSGDPRWASVRSTRTWLDTASDGGVTITIKRDGAMEARSHRAR
ncbi:MAG: ComEC/Rec2 family competence protein [Phycisphaerales bacterium]